MNINEFLEWYKPDEYKKREILEIKEDFVNENCEMFLAPDFVEQLNSNKFTKKLAQERQSIETNLYIKNFINRLHSIGDQFILFIYPENYSSNFLMAQEIAKKPYKNYILDNIFSEDDTKNWIAIFDKNDEQNIGMMFDIIYSEIPRIGDNYGGYKLFGKGLMYYADNLQYNGIRLEPEFPNRLAHFQGNCCRRDTDPKIILESRHVIKMLLQLNYFQDEYELFYNMWKVLLPFLHEMYLKAKDISEDKSDLWKDKVNELKSQMTADGIITSKWKSELSLFTLTKKEYPDTRYQFYPNWLKPQNLDIYIPSLNIAIEYQGIQHYQSIDYFGGEKGFVHRQELDERKRNLCHENGVKLIIWAYTDDISIDNLKAKIKEVLDNK